jgi:outer membrane protein TolC
VAAHRVERRLHDTQRKIAAARESYRILDEQLAVWADAFEDARLRSLMSETPQADHDLAEIRRHYDVARREHERQSAEIAEMILERDRLLRDWDPKESQ